MPLRNLFRLGLILTLFSLSSCYEIVEEITYTDDVKGVFAYTANLSQSKAKIKTILLLDTFMGAKVPDIEMVRTHIAQMKTILKNAEGISEVKVNEDYDNFIFRLECHFANTDNLNNALKTVAEKMAKAKDGDFVSPLAKTESTFTRTTELNEGMVVKAERKNNVINLMKSANYTCIYRFHKEVKSVSNKAARISKDQKAVFLKTDIPTLIKTPETLNNEITLK